MWASATKKPSRASEKTALPTRVVTDTAVVFGLFETGLGVCRALGRQGIQVIGIDYKKDIGWYSRYVRPLRCPHPIEEETAFLEWLNQHFTNSSHLPAFFTGDDFLFTCTRNRMIFSKYFLFNLPSNDLLGRVADKYTQYEIGKAAGINVPNTWLLTKPSELPTLENEFKHGPLFIKGREVNAWRTHFGGTVKGFIIRSYNELQERLFTALEHKIPVIIQEIIAGPDKNHYKYCAYISQQGEILAEFCLQKLRQYPIRFGVGSVVQSVRNQEVLEAGRKLLQNIEYQGIASIEFKYDDKDGWLKLIELNPRYWQQNSLAESCGVNFPYINFQDLIKGNHIRQSELYKTDVKWINFYMDLNSFLDYQKERAITVKEWLRSLKGRKVFSDFAADDPLPALWEIRFGKKLFKLPFFLWKKLSRRK